MCHISAQNFTVKVCDTDENPGGYCALHLPNSSHLFSLEEAAFGPYVIAVTTVTTSALVASEYCGIVGAAIGLDIVDMFEFSPSWRTEQQKGP